MWMIYLLLIAAMFAHATDAVNVYAVERFPESAYQLKDIVQLSLQHNPAIAGAEALLKLTASWICLSKVTLPQGPWLMNRAIWP
jgi:hypothetical protein